MERATLKHYKCHARLFHPITPYDCYRPALIPINCTPSTLQMVRRYCLWNEGKIDSLNRDAAAAVAAFSECSNKIPFAARPNEISAAKQKSPRCLTWGSVAPSLSLRADRYTGYLTSERSYAHTLNDTEKTRLLFQ